MAFKQLQQVPITVASYSGVMVHLDDILLASGFTEGEWSRLQDSWEDLGINCPTDDILEEFGLQIIALHAVRSELLNPEVVHAHRAARLEEVLDDIQARFGKDCWVVCAGRGATGKGLPKG
jgi:hypothetical protein